MACFVSYGGDIFTFVNDDGIFVENAPVDAPDLMAYNGVVHVINEVIDFEFPNPVGTCGTWTLNMYAPEGEGWSGFMQVLVDNVLVGEPTSSTDSPTACLCRKRRVVAWT